MLNNNLIIPLFIGLFIVAFAIILSFTIYFIIRGIMIERTIDGYKDKVSMLLNLPFNNKLRKLQALKNKHQKYEEEYKSIQKKFNDFSEIKIESFLTRLENTKDEIKKNKLKFPTEQLESINSNFTNLIKDGLRIIKKLDTLTYPEELQSLIFRNIQEYFSFFKNSYLSYRETLNHFNILLDRWLEKIKLKFKEYNNSETDTSSSINKSTLGDMINDIIAFAEFVELLLIGSTVLNSINEPKLKHIKGLSFKYQDIVSKNMEEFSKYSENYKKAMTKFINSKKSDNKFVIEKRINNILKTFHQLEISFNRQIKAYKLVDQVMVPIRRHYDDCKLKQSEIVSLTSKVNQNQISKINSMIKNLDLFLQNLEKIYDNLIRLSQQSKQKSFEVSTKILKGSLMYYEAAEKYQQEFSESLKFLSSNIETFSRFEKNMSDLNMVLVKMESNINEHNLKLPQQHKNIFNEQKEEFNKLVKLGNENNLNYNKTMENELTEKLTSMEDLLLFVERMNRISLIIETSLVILNNTRGKNPELDSHISMVQEEYELGNYQDSLSNLVKLVEIHKIKG